MIKKILLRTAFIAVLLGIAILALVTIINLTVVGTAEKYMFSPENTKEISSISPDCIIVLGAGLRSDGSPSHMLRDRLDTAIELYKSGVCSKLLMSGDHGKSHYDEVNTMKEYAVNKGVPPEDIYLDHAGFSTYETAYRAKEIFCVEKCILITQKYHLYRAVYSARALGIEAYGVNSDPYRYYGQLMRDIREVAARCKDFLMCIFKPEPTYLGEQIDIQTSAASETDG